jgi:hypothetical protein
MESPGPRTPLARQRCRAVCPLCRGKAGIRRQGMAQHQRLNRRGGCQRVARFEVLKLVLAWLRRSVARQHSSYRFHAIPLWWATINRRRAGLPNRLKSAAVRRRLIIFSIGICCHKVVWITSGLTTIRELSRPATSERDVLLRRLVRIRAWHPCRMASKNLEMHRTFAL